MMEGDADFAKSQGKIEKVITVVAIRRALACGFELSARTMEKG
jgi:hypothetical protein